jgi:intermembrane space import and assembly protein 40
VHIVHVTREDEDGYGLKEGELLGPEMDEALVGDGEIDWDCPCLQGMAHGSCGEAFKTAFTCFVSSTANPKGSDCVEHFVAMRDCMVAHPEDYPDLANDASSPAAESESPADSNDQAAATPEPAAEAPASPPAA